MISLWMLSGVTMWKNSCAAMSVTRWPTRVGEFALLQHVLGAERVLPRARARVGEVVEEGVAVHRQLAQEPARGVQHAAHGGRAAGWP